MNGHVYVLDRHNGKVRWSYTTGAPIESSPLVLNGVDYFGAWDGTVLRARPADASSPLDATARGDEDHLERLVRGRDGLHRRLRRAAAARSARAPAACAGRARVNGRVYGTPATADGRVFVPSSTGGSLTAFSTSGSRLWSLGTGSYVYSSPAVWNGRVYIGSYNGSLYCLSAASGCDALAVRRPAARSAARRHGRGRRRLLREPPAPDLRAERAHRQAGHLALARRRLRAGRGQRAPPAPARLLAALRDGAEEPPAMKKVCSASAARRAAGRRRLWPRSCLYRKHQGQDVRGSVDGGVRHDHRSARPPPPTAKIRWPMYRFDLTRQGNAEKMLVQPPYRHALVLPRALAGRVPARGRIRPASYFANADGHPLRACASKDVKVH